MEIHKRCLDRFASNDKAECEQREGEKKSMASKLSQILRIVEVKAQQAELEIESSITRRRKQLEAPVQVQTSPRRERCWLPLPPQALMMTGVAALRKVPGPLEG